MQTATRASDMPREFIRRDKDLYRGSVEEDENKTEVCVVPASPSFSDSEDEDDSIYSGKYLFKIESYDRRENLYLENSFNFLFRRNDDGKYIAIGRLRNDILIELTYDEKDLLKKHGFGTG